MRGGSRRQWFVAGLALLGVMFAGRPEARADLTPLVSTGGATKTTGITITGGFKPTSGDPPFDYIFTVSLASNLFSVSPPTVSLGGPSGFVITPQSSFTIFGLVGVTASDGSTGSTGSLASSIGTPIVDKVAWSPSITQTSSGSPTSDISNVTWTFLGNSPFTYNPQTNGFVGTFEVETTDSFPRDIPPETTTNPITYGFTLTEMINGVPTTFSDTNTFQFTDLAAVPEPASSTIVLLIGGTAAVAGLITRARRHRVACTS